MTTLLQDLNFYAATLDEPPNPRELFRRAAAELDRLSGLTSSVKCLNCEKAMERAADWYRCFDCGAHLCVNCCTNHFGYSAADSFTPHHHKMARYQHTITVLRRQIDQLKCEPIEDKCPDCGSPGECAPGCPSRLTNDLAQTTGERQP